MQVPGCDFGCTFAPVACQASVHIITTYCSREDWELHLLDIKQAFLHGKIDEVVYIHQPCRYEESGPNGERLVGRLNSSRYGIKQAAYMFYKMLQEELKSLGFVRCAVDHAVFTYNKGDMQCLTGWHINDTMGGSNNESFLPKIIGELLYLSLCTRPDVAHAVQHLSQFISRPTPCLYTAAKHILHYLASTMNHQLHYGDPT